MSSSFTLRYSLGNVIVAPESLNTQTSLSLPGNNYSQYGAPVDQNMLSMLENFANSQAPANAIPGQLWFDSGNSSLKLNISGNAVPVWSDIGAGSSNYGNSNVTALLNTGVSGNVIPSSNITYDLGNATNRWRDLYLSGNSIYLGGTVLSSSATGLSIDGQEVLINSGSEDLITSGNIAAANLSVNQNFYSNGNSYLGAIGNISITGGISGQIMSTDGAGNLSWTTVAQNVVYPINTVEALIDRFDPIYWTVDGPRSMSLCTTPYDNGFEARFIARRKNDLCGIIWESEDFRDHKYCAYSTNNDYTGLTWTFTVDVAPTCPVLNEETDALSLTVEATLPNGDPTVYYIALKNYAGADSNSAVRTANITIDWSTVQAGFDATIPVNASNVSKMFFGGIVTGFVQGNSDPLPAPIEGYIRITNSTVTGTGSTLSINQAAVAPHQLGMSTSYDDQYNLNPARVIKNCQTLGYREWINHYCGMSSYPSRFWNATVNRFVVPSDGVTPVVNNACKTWHKAFAEACAANKYQLIQSVSYEFFSEVALNGENGLPDWIQRDWFERPAETGYTPPSYFFSLCNTDAISYLHRAFVEFAAIADSANIPIYMQVGEPWWWINPGTNLPCVYDYPTKLAFNAATGLFMQDMGTVVEAKSLTASPFPEMYQFLQTTLGESVQSCRTAVRAVYPDAKVAPLLFLPTILNESAGIMNFINYPIPEYSYPNFDFMMTECYDWIVDGEMNRSYLAMQDPIEDFGYSPDLIQYLGGFVDVQITDTARRIAIWRRIIGNIKNNVRYNIQKQHIWAYPQVMSDSITIIDQNDLLVFYIGDTAYNVVRQDVI